MLKIVAKHALIMHACDINFHEWYKASNRGSQSETVLSLTHACCYNQVVDSG